ncbi:hypothetical protein HDV57DRAFT_501789 [Trichoderma longibrachiatum]
MVGLVLSWALIWLFFLPRDVLSWIACCSWSLRYGRVSIVAVMDSKRSRAVLVRPASAAFLVGRLNVRLPCVGVQCSLSSTSAFPRQGNNSNEPTELSPSRR